MAIFKTYQNSSLGLKGATPEKLKFKSVSAEGTPLGLDAKTPESVNFAGPNVNSNLSLAGSTPDNIEFKSLKNNFKNTPLSLKGNIPSYNYEDNLPEQGISRLSTDLTPPEPNHFA